VLIQVRRCPSPSESKAFSQQVGHAIIIQLENLPFFISGVQLGKDLTLLIAKLRHCLRPRMARGEC
jgi:hypothetical protein